MHIVFINPPFKAEYGKFSRESRSPAITKSGALYYPLWLIYAAAYCRKYGHRVDFIDAPAKPLDEFETLELVEEKVRGKSVDSDALRLAPRLSAVHALREELAVEDVRAGHQKLLESEKRGAFSIGSN